MEKTKKALQQLWKIIRREEMKILPGNLAFFLVLSAIPIITLLGVIASMFSISIESVVEFMAKTFPKEVSDLLVPYISGTGFDMNILLFMTIGFVLASNGAQSIIIASDTLYEIKSEDFLNQRIKSVFLAMILVILIIFILVVLAFGNMIVVQFLHYFGTHFYHLFAFLKWPIAFVLIFIVIKVIYTISPDMQIKSKYVNRGAMFTTLGWTIVTAIYSYYVAHFANYDLFYGGLSNIVILMMWVYILSYILVIGIAINAQYYQMVETTNHKDNN